MPDDGVAVYPFIAPMVNEYVPFGSLKTIVFVFAVLVTPDSYQNCKYKHDCL